MDQEAEILHVDRLEEALSPEIRETLQDVSPKRSEDFGTVLLRLIRWASKLSESSVRRAVRTGAVLLCIVLLCTLAGGLLPDHPLHASKLLGAFALSAVCVTDLTVMTGLARQTLEQIEAFSKLLLPVMSSAALASGAFTASGALYLGASFFFSILSTAIRVILIPLVCMFLALAAAACATSDTRFAQLQSLVGWTVTVLLKGVMYAFTGYLTLTGILTGSSDQAAVHAARSAISASVPVVGRIVSDASESVLASAQFLRASTGVFGALAVLAISLAPFFQIGAQYLVMKLTTALAGLAAEPCYTKLLSSVTTAMGYFLAMVAAGSLMILFSVCCFMKVVGSA